MTLSTEKQQVAPPSDDKRWKMVNGCMRRHGYRASCLIETLHQVQESFGYLDDESLTYVAQSLRLPSSMVYGVATFYHLFTLKPQGKHNCVVCMGTACYIKGTAAILEAIKEKYGVELGETTGDNQLSLLSARCVGACGLAPALVFDGEVAGKLGAEETLKKLSSMMEANDE